jgi:hypothetical protein
MSDHRDAFSEDQLAPDQVLDDDIAERSASEELSLEETVDGVPVLAEARPVAVAHGPLPAVQAAAVAATGFVAGAATLALVRRHSARKLARRSAPRRAVDMLPIVGSRSFIVDVHLLAKPGE